MLCSGQEPVWYRLDGIADTYPSGHDDRSVDAEGERLITALTPVAGERAERVEVGDAPLGIVRGDDAAADVAVQDDRRFANAHLAVEPFVFFMRSHPVDLEKHPETPAVDGLVAPASSPSRSSEALETSETVPPQ